MARGKGIVSLKETVAPEDIFKSNEEVSPPNFIFEDGEHGISGKYGDYALVKRKVAHRTGKVEDGELVGKVIEYIKWEDINYSGTFIGAVDNYFKYATLNKFKTKEKVKDFKEIRDVYNDELNFIKRSLKFVSLENKDVAEVSDLLDTKQKLQKEINALSDILTVRMKEIDKMYEEIKEKRRIIVEVDKPKKHKVKSED